MVPRGLRTHLLTPPVCQGHLGAAHAIGCIYFWGHGAAIDYPRAMAAYKVGAEGGHAVCQHQVGMMYYYGRGVAVDYQQARHWIEKAAAQDQPIAVGRLGAMYHLGKGVSRDPELAPRTRALPEGDRVGRLAGGGVHAGPHPEHSEGELNLFHHLPYRES